MYIYKSAEVYLKKIHKKIPTIYTILYSYIYKQLGQAKMEQSGSLMSHAQTNFDPLLYHMEFCYAVPFGCPFLTRI